VNYRHPGGSYCRSARAAQRPGSPSGWPWRGSPPRWWACWSTTAPRWGRRRSGVSPPPQRGYCAGPVRPYPTVRRWHRDWLGPGYGVATAESAAAAVWLAEHTGLVAEPVYTAKTAAALRALTADGTPDGPLLYWHTADRGGTPDTAGFNPPAS